MIWQCPECAGWTPVPDDQPGALVRCPHGHDWKVKSDDGLAVTLVLVGRSEDAASDSGKVA